MAEMIRGNCPHCGKPLEIPAELEVFSCLYCGERMKTQVLLAAATEGKNAPDLTPLLDQLAGCVINYPSYYQKLSKKEFPPAFDAYEADNAALLTQLDQAAPSYPGGVDALAAAAATAMLDALEAHMQTDKRWGNKRRRDEVFFETKVVLAIYFTPLLRKLRLSLAEPLRTELHSQWMARWPKQVWQPGDYDTLMGGFKKFRFCFITTATCAFEGKPDDCPELTAFRAFRDGWLQASPGGPGLIAEYYSIAPAIVAAIEYCDDRPRRYEEIRSRWLEPCYQALREDRPADCRDRYTDMIRTLRETYQI